MDLCLADPTADMEQEENDDDLGNMAKVFSLSEERQLKMGINDYHCVAGGGTMVYTYPKPFAGSLCKILTLDCEVDSVY